MGKLIHTQGRINEQATLSCSLRALHWRGPEGALQLQEKKWGGGIIFILFLGGGSSHWAHN